MRYRPSVWGSYMLRGGEAGRRRKHTLSFSRREDITHRICSFNYTRAGYIMTRTGAPKELGGKFYDNKVQVSWHPSTIKGHTCSFERWSGRGCEEIVSQHEKQSHLTGKRTIVREVCRQTLKKPLAKANHVEVKYNITFSSFSWIPPNHRYIFLAYIISAQSVVKLWSVPSWIEHGQRH